MGKAGTDFERQVEQLYLNLGAIDVRRNVNIHGHEIDVVALVPSLDGTLNRSIISCKDLKKPVGVELVREWYLVFQPLRNANEADSAVIVSSSGFTQDANAAARACGIKLLTAQALAWAGCDFRPYLNAQVAAFASEPVFAERRYIPLSLIVEDSRTAQSADQIVKEFLENKENHLLTILGDYGAGKTTLAKKLFQDCASAYIKDATSSRMPIFINLKDYPRHLNLQSLITDLLVNEFGARCPNFSVIKKLSGEGNILFIFDAFDEMATRTDHAITLRNFQALGGLFQAKAKLVMTCRTHYFKDEAQAHDVHTGTTLYEHAKGKNYQFAYVRGLEPQQIEEYVRAVCGASWREYLGVIQNTYNLPALAEKPILLKMITEVLPALVKDGRKVNSTSLYSIYVELWLKRDDWRVTLSRQDRLRFTMVFAEEMYRRKADKFVWEDVATAIARRWTNSTRHEIEQYQNDIRTCSFIRRDPKDDSYSFVHQSFMEYFVAARLYETIIDADDVLMGFRTHPPEVLDFLAGHMLTDQIQRNLQEWIKDKALTVPMLLNLMEVHRRWQIPFEDVIVPRMEIEVVDLRDLRLRNWRASRLHLRQLKMNDAQLNDVELTNCNCENLAGDRVKLRDVRIRSMETELISFNTLDCYHCAFDDVTAMLRLKDITWSHVKVRTSKLLTGSSIQDGSIRDCSFSESAFTGMTFRRVVFGHNDWTWECLDGVIFENCKFDDGGKSMFLSLVRMKELLWRVGPLMIKCEGVDPDFAQKLQGFGFLFG